MGYAAELDFTGIVIPYVVNGKRRDATLMVMVLPSSRMTLIYAIESQRNEHVCPAIAKAFKEYGAIPQVLVVDNFKGAVSSADIYGGEINPKLQALAHYFGIEIQPCPTPPPHFHYAILTLTLKGESLRCSFDINFSNENDLI